MATDSTAIEAQATIVYDERCPACMLEYNECIDQALEYLRQQHPGRYDQTAAKYWTYPKPPTVCPRHQARLSVQSGETTRMRAVHPPVQVTPEAEAKPEPQEELLPEWLAGALPAAPKRNPYEGASLTLFAKTDELGRPHAKPVAPDWMNSGHEISHPLFEPPTQMAIHQEMDFGQGTDWGMPRPKREKYHLSLPPDQRHPVPPKVERAAPLPPAEGPQATGAMPALLKRAQVGNLSGKLNSGEFPLMNAALFNVTDVLQRLKGWYVAFRTEAPPAIHEEIKTWGTLADNIATMSEGCARNQALHLQGIASSLRWACEYLHRAEQDMLSLPKEVEEARNAS